MFCKKCGKKIRKDAVYCDRCGEELLNKKINDNILVFVVIGIVLILLIAILCISVLSSNPKNIYMMKENIYNNI